MKLHHIIIIIFTNLFFTYSLTVVAQTPVYFSNASSFSTYQEVKPWKSEKVVARHWSQVFPELYHELETSPEKGNLNMEYFYQDFSKVFVIYRNEITILSAKGDFITNFNLGIKNLSATGHFHWSPDGNKILFVLKSSNPRSRDRSFYLLSMDGSIELIKELDIRGSILQPDWSPDGKWISYVLTDFSGGSNVWIKNLETGEEKKICDNISGNARWFHSSNKFIYKDLRFFRSHRGRTLLMMYDLDTRNNSEIYDGTMTNTWPTISGNDSYLLVDAGPSFVILDMFGNTINQFNVEGLEPQLSPDGRNIVFENNEIDGEGRILNMQFFSVNISTGDIQNLTPDPSIRFDSIRWYNNNIVVYK